MRYSLRLKNKKRIMKREVRTVDGKDHFCQIFDGKCVE